MAMYSETYQIVVRANGRGDPGPAVRGRRSCSDRALRIVGESCDSADGGRFRLAPGVSHLL